jgi:hypothetical protein
MRLDDGWPQLSGENSRKLSALAGFAMPLFHALEEYPVNDNIAVKQKLLYRHSDGPTPARESKDHG